MKFKHVAVAGLGVMGGSLCRALKESVPETEVTGIEPDPTVAKKAFDQGIVDEIVSIDRLPGGIDLLVLSAPVEAIFGIIGAIPSVPALGSCVIIDLASIKGGIMDAVDGAGFGERFIGCHPMTGSERSGLDSSRSRLYADAPILLVPHENTAPRLLDDVSDFWRRLGAIPHVTSAFRHDSMTALTSHVPHILAFSLNGLARRAGDFGDVEPFCGPGFRDMTRLAGSSPGLWKEIIWNNRAAVAERLDELIADLAEVRRSLDDEHDEELSRYLELNYRETKEERR